MGGRERSDAEAQPAVTTAAPMSGRERSETFRLIPHMGILDGFHLTPRTILCKRPAANFKAVYDKLSACTITSTPLSSRLPHPPRHLAKSHPIPIAFAPTCNRQQIAISQPIASLVVLLNPKSKLLVLLRHPNQMLQPLLELRRPLASSIDERDPDALIRP